MELADLDLNKIYSYADYFKWNFDNRVELINEKILKMSPTSNRIQQEVTGSIYVSLSNFLGKGQRRVYIAPFDVRLPGKSQNDKDILTVLQPDICVVCNAAIPDDRGCLGTPDLVIESLSPGNSKKEVKNKHEAYEEAGVKEFSIVAPIRQTVQVYLMKNERFAGLKTITNEDIMTSTTLPCFHLIYPACFHNRIE
jgi:Uma2 family endonuclease